MNTVLPDSELLQGFTPPETLRAQPASLSSWRTLLALIQSRSEAPVSHFQVAVVAVGQSGRAYWGSNLEFASQPIQQTVHAEQMAVAMAKAHHETGVVELITTAMPCGHCRQFLLELGQAQLPVTVLTPQQPPCFESLASLLPLPFTLSNPGCHLFQSSVQPTQVGPLPLAVTESFSPDSEARELLLSAYQQAYAPYTNTPEAVVIGLSTGQKVWGCSLESAAYNPTLSALNMALAAVKSTGLNWSDIAQAMILTPRGEKQQARFEHIQMAQMQLRGLQPKCQLNIYVI